MIEFIDDAPKAEPEPRPLPFGCVWLFWFFLLLCVGAFVCGVISAGHDF